MPCFLTVGPSSNLLLSIGPHTISNVSLGARGSTGSEESSRLHAAANGAEQRTSGDGESAAALHGKEAARGGPAA